MNHTNENLEDLREEIHLHLVDLFGDVLLLDCLLFSAFDGDSVAAYCSAEILDTLYRRLQDYIDDSAGEVAHLTRMLLDEYFPS